MKKHTTKVTIVSGSNLLPYTVLEAIMFMPVNLANGVLKRYRCELELVNAGKKQQSIKIVPITDKPASECNASDAALFLMPVAQIAKKCYIYR